MTNDAGHVTRGGREGWLWSLGVGFGRCGQRVTVLCVQPTMVLSSCTISSLSLYKAIVTIMAILATMAPLNNMQGKQALEEQSRWIATTVASAFPVQLGGEAGKALGWGRCLAVKIDGDMAHHRSQLGNDLASRSAADGLQARDQAWGAFCMGPHAWVAHSA